MKIKEFIPEGCACRKFYLPVYYDYTRRGYISYYFIFAIPALIGNLFWKMFWLIWKDLVSLLISYTKRNYK